MNLQQRVSFQHVTLESSEKKEWIPVSATRMTRKELLE
ncbi:WPE palindromic element domain-containing protein [Wolbachia endosymbiont of Ctenocephalides felis wCfeJ]|nr:WPE palindromic element domain-containing protein [Wolbachia endosymbiont of Ctenocephalides felis wCfeJ]